MLNARTPVLNGALSENGLQVQFMVINITVDEPCWPKGSLSVAVPWPVVKLIFKTTIQ